MIIDSFYPQMELHLDGHYLFSRFVQPHRVASTAITNGGVRDDLQAVYNNRVCEPLAHEEIFENYDPTNSHNAFCLSQGFNKDLVTGVETAANLNCRATSVRKFKELTVAAVTTAGLLGNAGRAGDPCAFYEWDGRFFPVDEEIQRLPVKAESPQTIITLLFINQEVSPGALLKSLITSAEAKVAAIDALRIGSLKSTGRSTGTGTDQTVSACLLNTGQILTGTGHHTILGQLIAEVTSDSITEALEVQNSISPAAQCDLVSQWRRFGFSKDQVIEASHKLFSPEDQNLLEQNLETIILDPAVVGAAAGLAELTDQLQTGIIPSQIAIQSVSSACAQICVAVSSNPKLWDEYRQLIADEMVRRTANTDQTVDLKLIVEMLAKALVIGFAGRWGLELRNNR